MKKIKSHVKSITAIIVALLVLISTSGISIYTHHCNHNQTNYYSVFALSAKCKMPTPKPAVKSCCQPKTDKSIEKCDSKTENEGCCTNHSKVVKIDTQTVLNYATPTIKVNEIQSALMLMEFHAIAFEGLQTSYLTKNKNELPPPLSTTEYLSRIQVYLI